MRYLVAGSLVFAGIVHLLPLLGVLGSARLTALYGLPFDEPNLAILMRHRAVLFGLLGAFMICAAFRPALQGAAFIGGFTSLLSFLWLVRAATDYNEHVGRVFAIDLAALAALAIGFAAYAYLRITA